MHWVFKALIHAVALFSGYGDAGGGRGMAGGRLRTGRKHPHVAKRIEAYPAANNTDSANVLVTAYKR